MQRKHRIFLLSPAKLTGIRANYLLSASANFELAQRLRSDGVSLGEVCSFISGLYFRGKLAYARAFAFPPVNQPGSFVITATAGLRRTDSIAKIDQIREWAASDIDAGEHRYRAPLDRDCRLLVGNLPECCDVILLGSIATSKYVDPLLEVFGERLLFPAEFVGRGDMSRGGLMLRSVEAGQELAYAPLVNAVRHGKRPAKLTPSASRRSIPITSEGRTHRLG